MITVIITPSDAIKGIKHVVQKLRAAGIPCRISFDDIRLCQEWDAPVDARLGEGEPLGYGVLSVEDDRSSLDKVFKYTPPQRSDVIDVEARVVPDSPLLLKADKQ